MCSTTSGKTFLFVNLIFAIYAGIVLVVAIQQIAGPTTLPSADTRDGTSGAPGILHWYLLAAGVYLVLLVIIALKTVYPRSITVLNVYLGGLLIFIAGEVGIITWVFKDVDGPLKSFNVGMNPITYIVAVALTVFGIFQLAALVLNLLLRREQYSRRDPAQRFSSDRGWKSSNEYRYHAGGQGTTCPRTSRQIEGHELWASAPPALPEYAPPALPEYSPPHSSRDHLINQ